MKPLWHRDVHFAQRLQFTLSLKLPSDRPQSADQFGQSFGGLVDCRCGRPGLPAVDGHLCETSVPVDQETS
jgi:hypothetical protein